MWTCYKYKRFFPVNSQSWCIIFQSLHSPDYCVVVQLFFTHQQTNPEEDEEEKSHDDVACNVINLCDNGEESDLEEYEIDVNN